MKQFLIFLSSLIFVFSCSKRENISKIEPLANNSYEVTLSEANEIAENFITIEIDESTNKNLRGGGRIGM